MKKLSKKIALIMSLALVISLFPLTVQEAYAQPWYKITYKITYSIKHKKKKPKLTDKSMTIRNGDYQFIALLNAKKSGIKWYSSNKKIATVKKYKNGACRIKAKKTGRVTIKAKYKGKTYKCKVRVIGKEGTIMYSYDDRSFVIQAILGNFDEAEREVEISVPDVNNVTLSYYVQDESIATCEWGYWGYDGDEDAINLIIHARSVGTTTVTVYNSFNSQKITYTVTVKEWNIGDDYEL